MWIFTRRSLEAQTKGSLLGNFWLLFNPLIAFLIYGFVFMVVFKGGYAYSAIETRADYALGLFWSISLVQFVQEIMIIAPMTIFQNPNFVKRVRFPLVVLPGSAVFAGLVRLGISATLVLLAWLFTGHTPTAAMFTLIPLMLFGVAFALGAALVLASLGVFFRDLGSLMQPLGLAVMFGSSVFYRVESLPSTYKFLSYNPLAVWVESTRAILLNGAAPTAGDLAYLGFWALFSLLLGARIFSLWSREFSDAV